MSATTAEAPARRLPRYQLDTGLAHMTPAERAGRGKAARTEVPRESHAAFSPSPDRPDPIALLEEQARPGCRTGPDPLRPDAGLAVRLLPRRGRCRWPPTWPAPPRSGLRVQLCGDAHLSNFGVFGSPERHLVFDVNDFDETLPGPWEWDVKRLAASLEVAARGNGFSARSERRKIVPAASRDYRRRCASSPR